MKQPLSTNMPGKVNLTWIFNLSLGLWSLEQVTCPCCALMKLSPKFICLVSWLKANSPVLSGSFSPDPESYIASLVLYLASLNWDRVLNFISQYCQFLRVSGSYFENAPSVEVRLRVSSSFNLHYALWAVTIEALCAWCCASRITGYHGAYTSICTLKLWSALITWLRQCLRDVPIVNVRFYPL